MKITALGFLFKCCCHLQTSFTGVIWQKKWLYYATGGQTGTDGRSLSRTHFCSCEENIPGARSHGTWKRLPASGGWAPTLGQGWSNCLQKKNLCQVEDWMSLFQGILHPPSSMIHPGSSSVIQSLGAFSVNKYLLSPYSVTHIKYWTPLVPHFRSSQTRLLCQPQLWPPVLCRRHPILCRGSLARLGCMPASRASCFLLLLLWSCVIGCPGEPTCNSCLHNLEW